MSKETVKTQIDLDITNKTTSKSISPLNVGKNMKDVVDLIPDITIKENISNKSTNIITDNTSDIKYPTTKAVATYVDGLAAESWVNKSINIITDATSDTKYPSVKAVKTYVDANIGGNQDLQSVLDNGNYAKVDSGRSYVSLLGDVDNRYIDAKIEGLPPSSGDVATGSRLFMSQEFTTLQNGVDLNSSSVTIDAGNIVISKTISTNETIFVIEDPVSQNTIKVPAKPMGTYTLATLDDIQNINTAFIGETYASTMSVAYNPEQPNFDINLTGNLDLTVTGTVNGDFGVVNLYFTSNETATINGVKPLSLVGAGEMVTVSYIHDIDGIKWYNDSEEITTIYNIASATSTGTFSNVGNICTGVGTTITANMVGAKIIKANGEEGIIATRISNTSFTTKAPFATDSVSISFKVKCIAYIINADGSVYTYDFNGNLISNTNIFGGLDMLGLQLKANMNVFSYGYLFQHGGVELYSTGNIKTNLPFYADDAAAAADGALSSGQGYRITGSTVFHIKP